MEMFPEVFGVEFAARHDSITFPTHQPCAAQAVDDVLVITSAFLNHLDHCRYQVGLVVHAEEVIAEVITERAKFVRGLRKQLLCCELPAGDEI
jgi:hypothetical protein